MIWVPTWVGVLLLAGWGLAIGSFWALFEVFAPDSEVLLALRVACPILLVGGVLVLIVNLMTTDGHE